MSSLETLLSQLIKVPSVNPRAEALPAETALAEFVAEWAEQRGMVASLHEVVDGRCNVTVTVPGDSADTLLLETHLDTVETAGMTVAPFEPTVSDGLLYARGACDAKGSLAMFLGALAELNRTGPRPHTVTLAGVIDEEHQYRGVQALRQQNLPVLAAVVGEPTSLRMVTAHKGCMRCHITAYGPGGHSSQPWGTTNPITTVAEVAGYLAHEYAPMLAAKERPLVGSASLAVTMVEGGSAPNMLPGRARLSVDRRTVAGEDPHEVWHALKAALEARWDDLDIAEPHITDHALETSPTASFVRAFADVLHTAGHDAAPKGVGHGTDASKISLDGTPAIVFGPGAIAQAHTPAEYLPLSELHAGYDVMRTLLRTPIPADR